MTSRPLVAAFAAVAVTVGITAWRVLPAASGSDDLATGEVAAVVALLHHDEQGIVLAHQAEAQSPLPSTQARATVLADGFGRQAAALTAVLDAHRVPVGARLVDTTRGHVDGGGATGCDLMPKDAVSDLAAAPPVEFDAKFTTLLGRHLVGGIPMVASVLGGSGLSASQQRAVRAPQGLLD